ncbi:MAG: DUF669 domain-containing protein [Phycisphaerales bacterium]|nr:DUF669 domain-containing protein [Phycisphaerales bacterium]
MDNYLGGTSTPSSPDTIGDMEFNPTDSGGKSGFDLLPDGTYDIEVLEAEERTSAKGNEMIALTIQASHPEGYPVRIWDYLVSVSAAVFKIEQFCAAAGLEDKFKAGRLLGDDCVGKKLRAKIEIESGRDNYSDRNSIKEYVASGVSRPSGISTQPAESAAPSTPKPIAEEEIPF